MLQFEDDEDEKGETPIRSIKPAYVVASLRKWKNRSLLFERWIAMYKENSSLKHCQQLRQFLFEFRRRNCSSSFIKRIANRIAVQKRQVTKKPLCFSHFNNIKEGRKAKNLDFVHIQSTVQLLRQNENKTNNGILPLFFAYVSSTTIINFVPLLVTCPYTVQSSVGYNTPRNASREVDLKVDWGDRSAGSTPYLESFSSTMSRDVCTTKWNFNSSSWLKVWMNKGLFCLPTCKGSEKRI